MTNGGGNLYKSLANATAVLILRNITFSVANLVEVEYLQVSEL